ncbi:MAG: sigma-54-dependent transcriptional regulator [Planctomycetota bacterium]|jgi:DNA-binding NtrC family response regulator
MPHRILLVDDDETVRTSIELYLLDNGYKAYTAATAAEGLEKLDRFLPHVLLVDLKMPDRDGFYLMREAHKRNSATAVIVITGHADIEKAVKATKMGAHQFIEKPFSLPDIARAIEQAVGSNTCQHHLQLVDEEGIRVAAPGWTLLGISDAMKDVYRKIMMVSQSGQTTVLIQGESGTGKELVARAIFESSGHANGGLVDVNCAALSESLLEAELFGHEKGAFTGAIETRRGLFGAADGGAIFLDEIGEMPLKLQAKLLRVLEEKSFKRVGGTQNIEVTCRVIASTNRNLWQMVERDEFRKDLYYRLDVFTIHIPPLRERPQDIPVLSAYFLKQLSKSCNKHLSGFGPGALDHLLDYDWPGNIRELRNVIERAGIAPEHGEAAHRQGAGREQLAQGQVRRAARHQPHHLVAEDQALRPGAAQLSRTALPLSPPPPSRQGPEPALRPLRADPPRPGAAELPRKSAKVPAQTAENIGVAGSSHEPGLSGAGRDCTPPCGRSRLYCVDCFWRIQLWHWSSHTT